MSGLVARWRARQQEHDAWLAVILAEDREIAVLEQARRLRGNRNARSSK